MELTFEVKSAILDVEFCNIITNYQLGRICIQLDHCFVPIHTYRFVKADLYKIAINTYSRNINTCTTQIKNCPKYF